MWLPEDLGMDIKTTSATRSGAECFNTLSTSYARLKMDWN